MAGCIIITYLYLPETKGRTPAELDAMFEARVPARKFKGEFFNCYHYKAVTSSASR
jgi:hypothetical protein